MRVGVVGNRNGWEMEFVHKVLSKLGISGNDIIISGGADGVDTFGQEYAKKVGAEMIILYPKPELPSPDRYFKRNQEIALRSDLLIAFDKGSSGGSGTLNTINYAKTLGKKVILVDNEQRVKE